MFDRVKTGRVFVALAAALCLAACFKVSNSLPADAPTYVRVYPGSAQIVSMDIMGMKGVAFPAAANPDEVLTFYRTQAQADGMPEGTPPNMSNQAAGQKSVMFGTEASGKFLIVQVQPQQQGSMVTLVYKPSAPPKS